MSSESRRQTLLRSLLFVLLLAVAGGLIFFLKRSTDVPLTPEGLAGRDSTRHMAVPDTLDNAPASPAEIDEHGIVGALRLAGLRALQHVAERGHTPGIIIFDGVADWLTVPQPDLLTALEARPASAAPGPAADSPTPPVRMEVKADARCAVVAAASVLAKVERDSLMIGLADPGYGWASNKGYASPAHIKGLADLGASDQHRRSWHLPGLDQHHD